MALALNIEKCVSNTFMPQYCSSLKWLHHLKNHPLAKLWIQGLWCCVLSMLLRCTILLSGVWGLPSTPEHLHLQWIVHYSLIFVPWSCCTYTYMTLGTRLRIIWFYILPFSHLIHYNCSDLLRGGESSELLNVSHTITRYKPWSSLPGAVCDSTNYAMTSWQNTVENYFHLWWLGRYIPVYGLSAHQTMSSSQPT